MPNTFYVGDRVQVNKDRANCANVKSGDVGTVTDVENEGVNDDPVINVVMDISRSETNMTGGWFFQAKHLTLVDDNPQVVDSDDALALDLSDPFERVIADMVETNRRKRADYAVDGSPWSNFDDVANSLGIAGFAPVDSANFNIEQKSARLRSLRKNGRMDDPANESVADTYLDRAVYSVIALAMFRYPSGKVES